MEDQKGLPKRTFKEFYYAFRAEGRKFHNYERKILSDTTKLGLIRQELSRSCERVTKEGAIPHSRHPQPLYPLVTT